MWRFTLGRRLRTSFAVLALASVLLLAACGETKTRFSTTDGASVSAVAIEVASPVDKATGVRTSTELTFKTSGRVSDVEVSGPGGVVAGSFLRGDDAWVPSQQLAYGTTYTVKATAKKGSDTGTVTSTFTTMQRPSKVFGADLYISDGDTVGIGMPIVAEWVRTIPEELRDDVERRLFVSTDPVTEGTWHWYGGDQVTWRPKDYWRPGTEVSVRLAIGGMELGNGYFGKRDRVVNFTVGSPVISTISNETKTMRVVEDGKVVREFPISLGKPSTPTSSGTHVVMGKKREAMFDSSTYGVPVDSPDGYRQKVFWNVRFTWGGEFVHSAPWSVADQGRRNVSHGCVNAAPEHAQWYYEFSKKGDVLIVEGTEAQVKPGDGWTDWNIPWEEYRKGSALYTEQVSTDSKAKSLPR